jgi:hypothetical protein
MIGNAGRNNLQIGNNIRMRKSPLMSVSDNGRIGKLVVAHELAMRKTEQIGEPFRPIPGKKENLSMMWLPVALLR